MTEDTKEMLTVPEVALALGVSQSAVRNAIYEKRLPSERKYGRPLVSRADFEVYKQRTRPGGEKPKGRPKKLGVNPAGSPIAKEVEADGA